jgi:hypothetical protein
MGARIRIPPGPVHCVGGLWLTNPRRARAAYRTGGDVPDDYSGRVGLRM